MRRHLSQVIVRALAATLFVANACATRPPPVAPSNRDAPGERPVDALAAAALRRFADQPATLSGFRFLPPTGTIDVLVEVERPQEIVLDETALPSGLARSFVGKRRAGLELEAAWTERNVLFIRFYRLEVRGTRGLVVLGVDTPELTDRGWSTCSDGRVDQYERQGGTWRFIGPGPVDCDLP